MNNHITPTAVQLAMEYATTKFPQDSIKQSIIKTMDFSGYLQQALNEQRNTTKGGK